MKSKILSLFMCAVMILSMTACGEKNTIKKDTISISESVSSEETSVISETETVEAEAKEETSEYEAAYLSVLNHFIDIILSGKAFEEDYEDGEEGIRELSSGYGVNEIFERVGFAYKDLSADGIPELIIGATNVDYADYSQIYDVYTCVDGEAVLLGRGYSRCSLRLLEDDSLFFEGANGAMECFEGVYKVENQKLIGVDFIFTEEADNNPEELAYYRNSQGIWDKKESNPSSYDEYEAFNQDCKDKGVFINCTPLSSIAGDRMLTGVTEISMKWVAVTDNSYYGVISPWDGENGIEITFSQPVKQVTFYSVEYDEEGNVSNKEFAYYAGSVTPDSSVFVGLTMIGLLPNNAVSYMDIEGKTYYYGITESGEDGSLILVDIGLN